MDISNDKLRKSHTRTRGHCYRKGKLKEKTDNSTKQCPKDQLR